MKTAPKTEMDEALAWCRSTLGPVEVLTDSSKEHPGHESTLCRLHTPQGYCYLKVHQTLAHWNNEVHAYERWAGAFGEFAPRLIAVRDEAPLALVTSEVPGLIVEDLPLPLAQERAVWRRAGSALVALHDLAPGEGFGPCRRDGACAEAHPHDAVEYVSQRFEGDIEKAMRGGYINAEELAAVRDAYALVPAFEGELPRPCHRDYCTANWLINPAGAWAGIIDFEFAYWDVRVVDFSRDPGWAWHRRPDLVEAFFEDYAIASGRALTPVEEQQLLVARAEYALSAILWGRDFGFYVFEQEGRESLAKLAPLLK